MFRSGIGKISLTNLAQVGPEGRQELWTDFEAQVAEEAPHFSRVLPRYKKTLDFQLTKMAEDSPRVRR